MDRQPGVSDSHYQVLAVVAGLVWGLTRAYEGLYGPCPNPEDHCELSMMAPVLLIGYGIVAGLIMFTWAVLMTARRSSLLSRPGRFAVVALMWWAVPAAIAIVTWPHPWSIGITTLSGLFLAGLVYADVTQLPATSNQPTEPDT